LSNRARYIQETLNSKIDLRRKKTVEVTEMLETMQFAMIDGDYKYLIKMPMDSVTDENVSSILKERTDTENELNVLRTTSLENMWKSELKTLSGHYAVCKTKREQIQLGEGAKVAKKTAAKKVTKVLKVKK